MSKSLTRVRAALDQAGIGADILEMPTETRTAAEAATAAGCQLDQIAKSIIFRGLSSGRAILFLTAGGNQVDAEKASALVGEPLGKADAELIRAQTGFAIGGVAPVGHMNPIQAYMDTRLLDFALIWAAAGTPRHIFSVDPRDLQQKISAQVSEFISTNKKM